MLVPARQKSEPEYSSSEKDDKPLNVQKKKPRKRNERIDQGYNSSTKHRPIRVSREREYPEEVEVGSDGEFDETIIYEHYKNGSLANDSYIMKKRSMIRPQQQEQTPPPVVRIYHCYPQRSNNQQVQWSNPYRQEQVGWTANGYRVVCAPPQQEQRQQYSQPSYCRQRRECYC